MDVHRQATSTIVRAPAKLNLFFEVLAKRSDGYHEIETLMVPVSLYDTLVASSESSGRVSLECHWAAPGEATDALGQLPAERENLAVKAVELLRLRAGVDRGLALKLIKRIPSAAGLGGGSSDAAAALLAANAVWDLDWTRSALAAVGAEIGSDVPFFLGRGAAICRGRGEKIEPIAGLGNLHFVVVRPPDGLSTAKVYGACRLAERPWELAPLIQSLRKGDARQIDHGMKNRLEEAAEGLSPWVGRLRREFAKQDCLAAQMSGSGTSYFGVCRHARHARRVARRLQARGIGYVYAVSMSN